MSAALAQLRHFKVAVLRRPKAAAADAELLHILLRKGGQSVALFVFGSLLNTE